MAITKLNSLAIPDDTIVEADLSYPLTGFSSTGIDDNATSTAITIDSSENVGIGTASPNKRLEISNGSNISYTVDVTAGNYVGLSAYDYLNSTYEVLGTNGSLLTFNTGSGASVTEAMRIDSSGRVGIGTSDPSSGTSTYYDDLVIKNDTSGTGAGITIQSNTTNGFGAVEFRKADGTQVGKIYASSAGGQLAFETGGAEAMRIDSSGRVGINNTSPSSYYATDLVVGAAGEGGITIASTATTVASYLMFADGTSGDARFRGYISYGHNTDLLGLRSAGDIQFLSGGSTERMRIDSSGNVGIGSTSPNANIHIVAGNPAILLQSSGAGTDSTLKFLSRNISNVAAYADIIAEGAGHNSTNAPIVFTQGSGQTERMRIDSTGNVKYGENTYSEPKRSYATYETLTYTSATNGSSETETGTVSLPYQAIVPFSIYGSFSGSGANSFQYHGYIHNVYYGASVQIVASDISHSPNIWNAFSFALTGAWNARKLQVTLSNTASYNPAQTGAISVYYHLSV